MPNNILKICTKKVFSRLSHFVRICNQRLKKYCMCTQCVHCTVLRDSNIFKFLFFGREITVSRRGDIFWLDPPRVIFVYYSLCVFLVHMGRDNSEVYWQGPPRAFYTYYSLCRFSYSHKTWRFGGIDTLLCKWCTYVLTYSPSVFVFLPTWEHQLSCRGKLYI